MHFSLGFPLVKQTVKYLNPVLIKLDLFIISSVDFQRG